MVPGICEEVVMCMVKKSISTDSQKSHRIVDFSDLYKASLYKACGFIKLHQLCENQT